MGIFDALESLGKAALNVAVTPVTLVADTVTLGGLMSDREEPYTATALKKALENLTEAMED